jgi:hypothetical protein
MTRERRAVRRRRGLLPTPRQRTAGAVALRPLAAVVRRLTAAARVSVAALALTRAGIGRVWFAGIARWVLAQRWSAQETDRSLPLHQTQWLHDGLPDGLHNGLHNGRVVEAAEQETLVLVR